MKADRIERLRALLEEPLLVTNPVNVFYLTGFHSSNAALLVEPDALRLFTDFRYAEGARSAVDGALEVVETKRSLLKDLAARLSGVLGFEAAHVTVSGFNLLGQDGLELVAREGLVEGLRAVKDDEELDAIRRSAAVTDAVYQRLAGERFSGRSERELAWTIEQFFHEEGADGLSFPVTVASGEATARPHTEPGERRIERGELVFVDSGALVDGYCSDCTRTFAVGTISDELSAIYELCREAQQAALGAIRPGLGGEEADAVARDLIASAGYGEAFGHGLGHGVGLLVHEAPRLARESADTLAPGNVATVEPGIYVTGLGGVRIEDLVIVTEQGAEVLSTFTKELVTVD